MEAHALELLHAALWGLGLLGSGSVAILVWFAKHLFRRLDNQDATMRDIRSLLESEVKQLREMHHDIDVRVTKIETACNFMHSAENQHRRWGDAKPK